MPLSKEAQTLLDEFASQPGVGADHVANLTRIINDSPPLVSQINEAVAQGHLKHIVPLPVGTHAGGEYNGTAKEMRLPLSVLASPPAGVPFDAGEPTFVLGHELQHGFNNAATRAATGTFIDEARQVAEQPGAAHDYTHALGNLIAANRRDEAGAEVAGWNALVGMVQHGKPDATLRDVYRASPFRASDFIDRTGTAPDYTYTAKPNLTLDADLHLQPSAANILAMGRNYFDHPPAQSRLGHNGNSDYANYYGAWGIGVIVQSERAYGDGTAQLQMNLQQLHLSESLMEQNGINLGSNTRPMPYQDTSTTPPAPHHFDHTATTFTHVPIAFQGFQVPSGEATQRPALPRDQPDHALLQQITGGLAAQGYGAGEDGQRLGHHLLALARQEGLTHVDHVVITRDGRGEAANAFLVQGGLHDPAQRRVSMDAAMALRTPQTEALRGAEAVEATQAAPAHAQSAPSPTAWSR